MKRPVFFRPEAEADIEAAALWYEKQCSGLGNQFLTEILRMCCTPDDRRYRCHAGQPPLRKMAAEIIIMSRQKPFELRLTKFRPDLPVSPQNQPRIKQPE